MAIAVLIVGAAADRLAAAGLRRRSWLRLPRQPAAGGGRARGVGGDRPRAAGALRAARGRHDRGGRPALARRVARAGAWRSRPSSSPGAIAFAAAHPVDAQRRARRAAGRLARRRSCSSLSRRCPSRSSSACCACGWRAARSRTSWSSSAATSRPGALRAALARALRDPSLTVAYWLADGERYVDADGRTVTLPDGPERAVTEVQREGRRIAALIHDPALADDPELVASAGAAAGLALENERLQAELRARLEELRASRARIVEATQAERRRIERDLHDGTQQRLVSIAMTLGLADSRLDRDPRPCQVAARRGARVALGRAARAARAGPGNPSRHPQRARPARRPRGARLRRAPAARARGRPVPAASRPRRGRRLLRRLGGADQHREVRRGERRPHSRAADGRTCGRGGRRRRDRRRGQRARHRPARTGRPGGRARRARCASRARRAAEPSSTRRSHARDPRRRLDAAARGPGAAARRGGLRRGRARGRRRRAPRTRRRAPSGRRDRRHPHAADPHRRGAACRARDP